MLQLVLAAIWLLDGVLQYQSFMFTKAFGQMIGGTSSGNPGVVARPINWNATLVEHHLVLAEHDLRHHPAADRAGDCLAAHGPAGAGRLDRVVARGVVVRRGPRRRAERRGEPGERRSRRGDHLRAAGRPAVARPTGSRSPETAPFVAARAVGATAARVLWLVLWGSLAYFALTPANRAPQALHDMVAGMADGEPGWLAALDKHSAALVAHQGLAASIVLAVALVIVAVGVYLPPSLARATLILAIVVAAVIWVFGEAFGEILTGGATDPQLRPAARPAGPGLLAARHRRRAAGRPPAG